MVARHSKNGGTSPRLLRAAESLLPRRNSELALTFWMMTSSVLTSGGWNVPFRTPIFSRRQTKNRDRRSRGKRKTKAPTNKENRRLNTVSLDDSGGVPFQVRTLPPDVRRARAVVVKKSPVWLTDQKFASGGWTLPFIDKLGRFTGSNCYRVDWHPAAVIGSTFATVYRRLRAYIMKHNVDHRHRVRNYQTLLSQCVAYYVISKNSYFWDRLLFLVKKITKNRRAITGLVLSYASKLDAHKWFVYGHVCLQTKWLTSRALRPRDKSSLSSSFCSPKVQHRGGVDRARFEYDAIWAVCSTLTQMVA